MQSHSEHQSQPQRFSSNFSGSKISDKSAVVAIYDTHLQAEEAVRSLAQSGFNMQNLSIVGKDFQEKEEVVGYYTAGDRIKTWGKNGAFWGGLWGLMFGSAFFIIPGIGPLLAAGPIVAWIVGALEGAVVIGGLSAVGAGLYSIGIPEDSIIEYETQLRAGKFVVVAHGTQEELDQTSQTFATTKQQEMKTHSCCS